MPRRRDSLLTAVIYECVDSDGCTGRPALPSAGSGRQLEATAEDDRYCEPGYAGPLCERCLDDDQYFDMSARSCKECPSLAKFAIPSGILVVLAVLAAALHAGLDRLHARHPLQRLAYAVPKSGIFVKAKIVIVSCTRPPSPSPPLA